MTVRTRLTLWYAAVMFVSLALMGILTYQAFAPETGPKLPADEADEGDLREMLRILFWCGVPPALIALAGGWWLMRRAFAPLARLTAAIEATRERNLGEKLPVTGNGDELDRITEVFNAMTARLQASFRQIREFTLHASHELKTPLTVLHGEIETELRDAACPPAQRERLAGQLDEIQRLAKIVDGLTLLTKADAGQVALKREPVALEEIVRDGFEDAQLLAKAAAVSVRLTGCDAVKVSGDRHRLRQLLLNLADNAIKYNHRGGTVEFSLRAAGRFAELQVTNTGPGIAPEALPRVFERFYRGNAPQTAAVEGCGLGLSIVQWIVSAHGGDVAIESTPGGLTTVTVRLPTE